MEKEIIKFWSKGCGNCKAMAPIVDAIASEHKDIKFSDYDTADNEDLTAKYEVSSLPTLVFLKDGEMMAKLVGLKPKSLIAKKIAEVF